MDRRTSRLASVSIATVAMVFVLPLAGFFFFDWFPQPCELLASVGQQSGIAKAVKTLFPIAQACGGGGGGGGPPPPPPPASITVFIPNGGETWYQKNQYGIFWSSTSISGNVKIDVSYNGGSTYTTLFGSTPNDGVEPWRVSGSVTNQARIRISSVDSPTVKDQSDGSFSIVDPCDVNAPREECGSYSVVSPVIWKWKQSTAEAGVRYTIDIDSVPAGITVAQFKQAVDAAFTEWSQWSRINFIRDPTQIVGGEAGLCNGCGGNLNDVINSIHFLARIDPGTTDADCIRNEAGTLCLVYKDEAPNDINRDYKRIKYADTVLDLTPSKPWTVGAEAGKYDLQSTITHEIGHWLYLEDFYGDGESKLTMYGTTLENTTQKRTLGTGDKIGLNFLYDGGAP